MSIDELRELCALTLELTKLRQAECKHLCIENFAPELTKIGSKPVTQLAFAPGVPHTLYDYIEATRSVLGSKSHIQNSVDGLCTALGQALYKLRRLQ